MGVRFFEIKAMVYNPNTGRWVNKTNWVRMKTRILTTISMGTRATIAILSSSESPRESGRSAYFSGGMAAVGIGVVGAVYLTEMPRRFKMRIRFRQFHGSVI